MHSLNLSLSRLSPFQKMWLWWRENNRNVVVVVEVEGNNRNGEAKKGGDKVKKLFVVVKRASLPSSSLNMRGLLTKNQ